MPTICVKTLHCGPYIINTLLVDTFIRILSLLKYLPGSINTNEIKTSQ